MSISGSVENEIKISGTLSIPDTIQGKSAYEIAVENGFNGTVEEWLASLKGEQGEQGEQGDKGDTGAQGEQGEKGPHGAGMYTGSVRELAPESNEYEIAHVDLPIGQSIEPHDLILDANGDVWRASGASSGLAEATGINLKGPQGEQGIQGIQGAKGDKGDKGDTGADGKDGTGVYISEIAESAADGGENIIRFSDGTYLSVRNGNRGRDGQDYVLTESDTVEIAEQAVELIDGVPSYWLTALEEGAEAINTALCTAGRNKSAFLFYSDSHWNYGSQKSPILLKYLYKHTGLTKTIFGGDIVNDEATDYDTMAYLWEWRNMLKYLPNHHSVVGNHDDGNSTNNLFSEQYVYGYLLAAEETPDIVRGEGMYYYIDHSPEKTRYLYLDTAYKGLDDTQKEFIKQALISTPSGWHIVVISHIWYMPDYDQYDQRPVPLTGLSTDATTLTAMLDAYNSRTGDYVDCGGWVEFCIGGHIHYDYDGTTETGIPIILVETDSKHTRGNYTYTAGTTTEASVNGIIADYDNHKIYIVRIGRGESREVEITNYIVNYTNVLPLALAADGMSIYNGIGYKADTRWSTSANAEATLSGTYITGWIPISIGDIVYLKNITMTETGGGVVHFFNNSFTEEAATKDMANLITYHSAVLGEDGNLAQFTFTGDYTHIRIQCKGITEASIITINEPIE